MNFYTLLGSDAIQLNGDSISSRKKVLETISSLLTNNNNGIKQQDVFIHLLEREKLGSTGLGGGVAIPHCRMPQLDQPKAALLRTGSGIDYDAPDNMPVRLFFALLVPEDAIDSHLQVLAGLAAMLSKDDVKETLSEATDTQQILHILRQASR